MAKLIIESGRLRGQEIQLSAGRFVIGRDEGVNFELPDRLVSGKHLLILPVGNSFLIEDLQTKNGTLVNNKPLTRALLAHGDEVVVGTTALRFDAFGEASPAPAARPAADPPSDPPGAARGRPTESHPRPRPSPPTEKR